VGDVDDTYTGADSGKMDDAFNFGCDVLQFLLRPRLDHDRLIIVLRVFHNADILAQKRTGADEKSG
jgi:hypothetical protein